MGRITDALKLQSENLKGSSHVGDTQVDGRITLRHLKERGGVGVD
jgi:hypothetical protein